VGRAALLVAALANGDYALLDEATRDRLHQPARQTLFPAMPAFFVAAREAGALGTFLSGAGSALLALVEQGEQGVERAFGRAAEREGIAGRTLVTDVGGSGAQVLP
jgi:homoserine kinase